MPGFFIDALRRNLYVTSIGARPSDIDRVCWPGGSAHNPDGLEERTILAADLFDISITPRPAYPQTLVALRSAPKHEPGTIWRAAPPVVVAPAWALEAPPRYPRNYIADEPYDFLGDPEYPREPALAAPYLL